MAGDDPIITLEDTQQDNHIELIEESPIPRLIPNHPHIGSAAKVGKNLIER